ncbi:hypothetical protein F4776DRAFT_661398 [Hypoxylon sp. NC0597]|nr:hypothetical protein F4776DRAFT_661398 [Hypoxylon sp. NC0597]
MAAPLSGMWHIKNCIDPRYTLACRIDTSGVEKRMPDVDQEITNDGYMAVHTNALWDSVDEGANVRPYQHASIIPLLDLS